ncbi:hypothetical protein ACOMHN_022923 [Nucella lapillus]
MEVSVENKWSHPRGVAWSSVSADPLTGHCVPQTSMFYSPLCSSLLSILSSLLTVVANYYGNKKQYEPVEGTSISWAGGRTEPPTDNPQCGFDGSKCPPEVEDYLSVFRGPWGNVSHRRGHWRMSAQGSTVG